jgi:hypothetical protein
VHIGDQDSQYFTTVFVKLVFVALSGVFAGLHVVYRGKPAVVGLFAALGLLFALAATFVGVQLHG